MEQFYKIGRAAILQAIGLKQNTKLKQHQTELMIDEEKSGCKHCSYKAIAESYGIKCDKCNSCENIVYKEITKTVTVYDNEKNRYGKRAPLTLDAAKTFFHLHTYRPDSKGFIKQVPVRTLAESVHCTKRTIYNCFKQLQEKGYISYSRIGCGLYMVHIIGYSDYFKPATEGGRGYITISTTTMNELMNMHSLLSFRLSVRTLSEITALGGETSSFNAITKTYRDMRLSLPGYCKPNVIRKSLEKCFCIFKYEVLEHGIHFALPDLYNAKKKYPEQQKQYTELWTSFISQFNNDVQKLNANQLLMEQSRYADFFDNIPTDSEHNYRCIAFKKEHFDSLVALSMEYDFKLVYEAIKLYYATYIMQGKKDRIASFGGLLRHLIREVLKESADTQYISSFNSYSMA